MHVATRTKCIESNAIRAGESKRDDGEHELEESFIIPAGWYLQQCFFFLSWWLRAGLILQIEPPERNLISLYF